jgi:hypothetical protein
MPHPPNTFGDDAGAALGWVVVAWLMAALAVCC